MSQSEGLLDYRCPNAGYLAGLSTTVDDNHGEDIQFNFYCCEVSGTSISDCTYSDVVEDYDGHTAYVIAEDMILKGIKISELGSADRPLQFEVCQSPPYVCH